MSEVFRHEIRARYAECDAQGCVFNANYLTYFDVAMTEFWREIAMPYQEMNAAGTDMVVAEAGIRYRKPVMFDDLAVIEAGITRLGNTSISVGLRVVCNDELRAEGELRYVFVRTGSSEVIEIPPELRRGMEPYVTATADGAGST
jgi:acyl-CoA thioester hydrolase